MGLALIVAMLFFATFGVVSANPNADCAHTDGIHHIYLDYCGDYEVGYSDLYDDVYGSVTGTRDYDEYWIHLESHCYIQIEVIDCCLMGDTMLLYASKKRQWRATSPDYIWVSGGPVGPKTFRLIVGYIPPHTGVFPAGYDIYIYTSANAI